MKNSLSGKEIFSIPNILSLLRICLIPFILWLYIAKKEYTATLVVITISAFTDVVDGFIARRFNMITELGKLLDPISDKFTQISVFICLVSRFHLMIIPLVLLLIKELSASITGFIVIRKTNNIYGALWHGKLATVCIYFLMAIHLVWSEIPTTVSLVLIIICSFAILLSCILYLTKNIKILASAKKLEEFEK